MQKKTKSILEELDSLYIERDRRAIIETRASNLIETAIRLLEQIDAEFSAEQAENLQRKTAECNTSLRHQQILTERQENQCRSLNSHNPR